MFLGGLGGGAPQNKSGGWEAAAPRGGEGLVYRYPVPDFRDSIRYASGFSFWLAHEGPAHGSLVRVSPSLWTETPQPVTPEPAAKNQNGPPCNQSRLNLPGHPFPPRGEAHDAKHVGFDRFPSQKHVFTKMWDRSPATCGDKTKWLNSTSRTMPA